MPSQPPGASSCALLLWRLQFAWNYYVLLSAGGERLKDLAPLYAEASVSGQSLGGRAGGEAREFLFAGLTNSTNTVWWFHFVLLKPATLRLRQSAAKWPTLSLCDSHCIGPATAPSLPNTRQSAYRAIEHLFCLVCCGNCIELASTSRGPGRG